MDERRSQIKKYFKTFPKWAIWMIVIGVFLLGAYGLGLILIAIGVWGIFSWSQKPSDQQMDNWIAEDLKGIEDKALNKTGVDRSELVGETVVVYGPRFWNIGGADTGISKGKDEIIRFTPIGVTVINFTQNQLVTYQCAFDLTTGNTLSESTDEYFYRDVVSVATQTQSKSYTWESGKLNANNPLAALVVAGKLQLNTAETFVLTTSGGTSVEVVIRDIQLIQKMKGDIPASPAEKAVQSVRKMLREKKGQALSA